MDAGENIVKAINLVSDTHRQVSLLIGALDEAFESGDWVRVKKDWVGGSQTGFQSTAPKYWLAKSLYRAYMPLGENKGTARSALLVIIHLAPDKQDAPTLAAVGVRFRKSCSEKEFWSAWRWDNSWDAKVLAQVGFGIPAKIDPKVWADALPPAEAATVLFVRLCELSKENLDVKFISEVKSMIKNYEGPSSVSPS